MLPAREALLRGALGADLISFNHFDYVRHFLNACMRVRSRRPAVPSRHRRDSFPSHNEVGGFFFDFERTAMLRAGARLGVRAVAVGVSGQVSFRVDMPGGHRPQTLRRERVNKR